MDPATPSEEVELTEVENLKPAEYIDLREVLPLYAKILNTGIISRPVIIDGETGVILMETIYSTALTYFQSQKYQL